MIMKIDNILLYKLTAQEKESPRLRSIMMVRGVESFVLGDCHVADAPRNDVLDFAPRNDVPVAFALNIPAGQWHTLRALESGTVILEVKDGAYEPISPADILSM